MAIRKYLLIFLLLFCLKANAQKHNFQQADSITHAQYAAGNWPQLLIYGEKAIRAGTDFPLLRLRMAYAFFITQNYTAALQQYDQVLANNAYDQTARYYAYWCNKYLNREQAAAYHASFIDKKLLNGYNLNQFGLIDAGVETNLKFPENRFLGTASYSRVFVGNHLGWRLQAEQAVAYYTQSSRNQDFRQQYQNFESDYNQFEYYGKLSYSISENITLLGAYHYLHTNQPNDIGLLGLKFSQKNLNWQADFNYSLLNGRRIEQYNAKLDWYPLGNLNFYTQTRSVLQRTAVNQLIFNQLIGGKIVKDVWMEATTTLGRQDNYLEYDALYVYNFVDATTFKAGGTAYFQLNPHLLLPLTYMFERKNSRYQNQNYNQHSITAALIWKF